MPSPGPQATQAVSHRHAPPLDDSGSAASQAVADARETSPGDDLFHGPEVHPKSVTPGTPPETTVGDHHPRPGGPLKRYKPDWVSSIDHVTGRARWLRTPEPSAVQPEEQQAPPSRVAWR